jgi:hypothetical protein
MTESASPDPTLFEKRRQLVAKVITVPKDEVDRRQGEWRKDRDDKKVEPANVG